MEIYSPPFPKTSSNPNQVFHYLVELYDWVDNQRDWANMEASRLNAPDGDFIPNMGPYPAPSSDRYLGLSVLDMYMSWQGLRTIREKYDSVVRTYEEEEAWASDPCIFHRINLVKTSALLLSMAFLDREKREAKEADIIKSQRKQFFNSLKDAFGSDGGIFQKDDDDEIDFDALFNPPDKE